MSKIVKSGTAEAPVYTETATTLTDKVMLGLTAPLALIGDEGKSEFYSKDDIAVASVVDVGVGFVLGDKFGDKVPVLGQRR